MTAAVSFLGNSLILFAAFEEVHAIGTAHVKIVCRWIVRAWRPVRASSRSGFRNDSICPKRSEYAALVHQRIILERDINLMGDEGIASRKRLSCRRQLARLLGHGLFINS